MQGMVEACMDMQIELQRSLHQEVSAALNRSISSGGQFPPLHHHVLLFGVCFSCFKRYYALQFADVNMNNNGFEFRDECQWDHVKRGICCLCQKTKIDSLLYRYQHPSIIHRNTIFLFSICTQIEYLFYHENVDVTHAGVGTCARVQSVQKILSSLRESVRCAAPPQQRLYGLTSSSNKLDIHTKKVLLF